MNGGPSLLEQLRGLIERTYGIETGLSDIGRFVVGNSGYRRFYAGPEAVTRVDSQGIGARMLVRELPGALRACIYYPDELIETLERHPPHRGVHDLNVDAFSTLVEELDHLLLLVWRRSMGRPVSLLELELQANVTKHLVLTRFLAGARPRLEPAERSWLRHHLFEKHDFVDADRSVIERYRQAARFAVRFLDKLPASARKRIRVLRRFYDADTPGKLALIPE